jgi:hypothetical protein
MDMLDHGQPGTVPVYQGIRQGIGFWRKLMR